MTNKIIIDIQFNKAMGRTSVCCDYEDNTFDKLFSFYDDELSFSKQELLGLTGNQAMQLHHDRDVAYLQS